MKDKTIFHFYKLKMKLNKYLAISIMSATLASGCKTNLENKIENEYKQKIESISDINAVSVYAKKINLPHPAEYISEKEFNQLTDKIYKKIKTDPTITKDFYRAVIQKESSLNKNAYNESSGARGLGQLLKDAWEDVDTTDFHENAFDTEKNLEVSLKYLNWIPKSLKKLNPNWNSLSQEEKLEQIIASYNWGIGKMKDNDWDFSKAPKETKNYRDIIYSKLNIKTQ